MNYNKWIRERSSKTKKWKLTENSFIVQCIPSTAEIRRWLRDRNTPRAVKGKLWAFLRNRQTSR